MIDWIPVVVFHPGDELEYYRPGVYRNVARQLNISVGNDSVMYDAFMSVAAEIFSTGMTYFAARTLHSVFWCIK